MLSGAQWIQIVFAAIGVINIYVMFGLNRGAKKRDEHDCCHKDLEKRVTALENHRITEERFRMIIREELQGFELRLIKEGRLEA